MHMPCVRQTSFADFEAFEASLPAAVVSVAPLGPGAFSSTLTEFHLGDVVLQIGHNTPLMGSGSVSPGFVWIGLPLGAPETLRLNGRAVGPGEIAVAGSGAGVLGANPRDTRWALIALPASVAEALLESACLSPCRPGTTAVYRAGNGPWAQATSLLKMASDVAGEEPEVFEVAEARQALRSEILEVVGELLADAAAGTPALTRRAVPERCRLVRAVEDHVRADPRRTSNTDELSTALGVPRTRLRAAVQATFSVDCERYLRLWRLTLARTALRSGKPGRLSVAQVAVAHGFGDAASFVRDYREVFATAPPLPLHDAE